MPLGAAQSPISSCSLVPQALPLRVKKHMRRHHQSVPLILTTIRPTPVHVATVAASLLNKKRREPTSNILLPLLKTQNAAKPSCILPPHPAASCAVGRDPAAAASRHARLPSTASRLWPVAWPESWPEPPNPLNRVSQVVLALRLLPKQSKRHRFHAANPS